MSGSGSGSRRERSRSPHVLGYRRGDKGSQKKNNTLMTNTSMITNSAMSNPMTSSMNSMMNNMYQQGWNTTGNMNSMPANNMALTGGNMNNSSMPTQNMMQGNMSSTNVDPPLPPMPPMPSMPANMPTMTNMGNMMMPGAMMGMGTMDMMSGSGSMDMNMLQQQHQMMNMGNANNGMDMNMMGGMMMDPSTMGMGNMNNMNNMTNMTNMANMATMPNMTSMTNMQNMPNMQNISMFTGGQPPLPDEQPPKQEIVFKNCKLIPPSPGTSSPPMRPRPLGCRTIFVGGLPEKIRESMVRDVFERYGRIHTLRLSKKNFCHIRYDRESSVDEAMAISGFIIKVIEKDEKDKPHDDDDDNPFTTGVLHVDYALSRDDQNEYERRQRQALRIQQQHMEELEQQMNQSKPDIIMLDEIRSRRRHRSPSPSVVPFSNAGIVQLMEKIKSEEFFSNALPTLLAWLERGECSKKHANQFYTMIQSTNSHIRRLFNEKMAAEEELMECKERVKQKIEGIINLLEQVGKVLNASSHKRVWDHFTKPQRKNIETWQKMTQEFSALKEEFNEKFENDDGEFNYMNSKPLDSEEVQNLKRLNDSLQFQLEAYKNEVDVIKTESKSELEKYKAQFIARQALQGHAMPPLPEPQIKPPPPPPLPDDLDAKVILKNEVEAGCGEALLIGTISAFMVIHPQGASLDYVVSYIRALFPHVSQATVHHVLQKHKDVFTLTTTGVGANIENRWKFIGYSGVKGEKD